jgi:predicted phosphate transport protein (TIGR00153 family)
MAKTLDTLVLLQKAIITFSKRKTKKTGWLIEKLLLDGEEIDALRRSVFKELVGPTFIFMGDREDLMHLVRGVDIMADHVRDSARNLKILVGTDIPKKILDANIKMVGDLVDCATVLRDAIEKIETNPPLARELLERVDSIEHHIDEEYLKTKSLLIEFSDQISAGIVQILSDFVVELENTADTCADTADYLKILIR